MLLLMIMIIIIIILCIIFFASQNLQPCRTFYRDFAAADNDDDINYSYLTSVISNYPISKIADCVS